MIFYSEKRGLPAGNPIANALVVIVGLIAIAASIVLGFLAFIVLASVVLVMAAVIGIRLWWFNRQIKKAGKQRKTGDESIEGEFIVIERRSSE